MLSRVVLLGSKCTFGLKQFAGANMLSRSFARRIASTEDEEDNRVVNDDTRNWSNSSNSKKVDRDADLQRWQKEERTIGWRNQSRDSGDFSHYKDYGTERSGEYLSHDRAYSTSNSNGTYPWHDPQGENFDRNINRHSDMRRGNEYNPELRRWTETIPGQRGYNDRGYADRGSRDYGYGQGRGRSQDRYEERSWEQERHTNDWDRPQGGYRGSERSRGRDWDYDGPSYRDSYDQARSHYGDAEARRGWQGEQDRWGGPRRQRSQWTGEYPEDGYEYPERTSAHGYREWGPNYQGTRRWDQDFQGTRRWETDGRYNGAWGSDYNRQRGSDDFYRGHQSDQSGPHTQIGNKDIQMDVEGDANRAWNKSAQGKRWDGDTQGQTNSQQQKRDQDWESVKKEVDEDEARKELDELSKSKHGMSGLANSTSAVGEWAKESAKEAGVDLDKTTGNAKKDTQTSNTTTNSTDKWDTSSTTDNKWDTTTSTTKSDNKWDTTTSTSKTEKTDSKDEKSKKK